MAANEEAADFSVDKYLEEHGEASTTLNKANPETKQRNRGVESGQVGQHPFEENLEESFYDTITCAYFTAQKTIPQYLAENEKVIWVEQELFSEIHRLCTKSFPYLSGEFDNFKSRLGSEIMKPNELYHPAFFDIMKQVTLALMEREKLIKVENGEIKRLKINGEEGRKISFTSQQTLLNAADATKMFNLLRAEYIPSQGNISRDHILETKLNSEQKSVGQYLAAAILSGIEGHFRVGELHSNYENDETRQEIVASRNEIIEHKHEKGTKRIESEATYEENGETKFLGFLPEARRKAEAKLGSADNVNEMLEKFKKAETKYIQERSQKRLGGMGKLR